MIVWSPVRAIFRPGSRSRVAPILLLAAAALFAVWYSSSWAHVQTYVSQNVPVSVIPFAVPKQSPIDVAECDDRAKAGVKAVTSSLWEEANGGKGSRVDYEDVQSDDEKGYMRAMLDWPRPKWEGHWPPFADYITKEYDPNRWGEFEIDNRFYTAGHYRLSSKVAENPVAYNPFPEYNSARWRKEWHGTYTPCTGPRERRLNTSTDDQVYAYASIPASFPKVFAGSYDVVGLNGSVCFDRYSKYGPYGLGDDEVPLGVLNWRAPKMVPVWADVPWGQLQDECLLQNAGRYAPGAGTPTLKSRSTSLPDGKAAAAAFKMSSDVAGAGELGRDGAREPEKKFRARTAVVIRAWTGYTYEENDVMAIRAMISELNLASGGEYEVFLLVHAKDSSVDIFGNDTLYREVLEANVPRELRSIALLWNEAIFPQWYPKVGDWQVYWQQFMCLQWFSLKHPQFDYVWNWETDARYTGHHYDFFENTSAFSAKQPRKLLWERNKRYYLPALHGSYASFVSATHAAVLNASAHSLIPPPVWGPRPYPQAVPPQSPLGPHPPTSFSADNFTWGVNHPADFITLLPLWDPRNTSWSYKDKIWNYIPGARPVFTPEDPSADAFTNTNFTHIDRRVFINTVARFSKTLLHAMHMENRAGRSMQAEMWPSSVALQHGLKAVYAPHPIFSDRHWPTRYAGLVFDAAAEVDPRSGGALQRVQGAWTEMQDSPYNHDREANFGGWSWYFSSGFGRRLYRRWLGWEVVGQGWGEKERVEGGEGSEGERREMRMCMPGMLLHPVKRMARDRLKV